RVKAILNIIDGYVDLSSSEQVTKLYITNYLNMIDPDTGRMYPVLNSMLDTRRMSLAQPNLSQLAKNSALAYVRSFFIADEEDHVVISADWSS
ncbi:DNA polymerase, partial [Lactococcus petauri]|uniref:DNA polymerase n=1 Tax=Lactococcus petauri TaxID=1940789 RepID=UPI0021F21633